MTPHEKYLLGEVVLRLNRYRVMYDYALLYGTHPVPDIEKYAREIVALFTPTRPVPSEDGGSE